MKGKPLTSPRKVDIRLECLPWRKASSGVASTRCLYDRIEASCTRPALLATERPKTFVPNPSFVAAEYWISNKSSKPRSIRDTSSTRRGISLLSAFRSLDSRIDTAFRGKSSIHDAIRLRKLARRCLRTLIPKRVSQRTFSRRTRRGKSIPLSRLNPGELVNEMEARLLLSVYFDYVEIALLPGEDQPRIARPS